jgi:putative Mg2+ transporter-C (MgtC) family protein
VTLTPFLAAVAGLSVGELVLRLGLAAALTGAIGLERELRDRSAGIKTHLLVGVGSALITLVSAYGWQDIRFDAASGVTLDPSRLAAQIVSGIGFLGAGAIIRQGSSVRGLTTAATLWVVAAIGIAAGAGFYLGAVLTTVIVIVGLWPLRHLQQVMSARIKPLGTEVELELTPGERVGSVLDSLEEAGGTPSYVFLREDSGRRRLSVHVDGLDLSQSEDALDHLTNAGKVRALHLRASGRVATPIARADRPQATA